MSDLALDLIFIIIVLLGTAVLGILIGYVFGLIQKKKATAELEKQIVDLESELFSFQEEKVELERRTRDLMKALAEVREEVKPSEKEVIVEKKAKEITRSAYNLKIIEGIGPKIEQILKEAGIDTWVKLSMTNPDEIRSLLISKGGSSYRAHDPRTWPYQAKLAAEGLWKDLKDYQDRLSGGK